MIFDPLAVREAEDKRFIEAFRVAEINIINRSVLA
jgi:hypothetical protein